jgi:hypothetical protein
MKARYLLLVPLVLLLMHGCRKAKCPEPETTINPINTRLKLDASNGKDVNICDNPTLGGNNYSTLRYLVAQSWTNGGFNQDQYIMLDFDLSSIPAGATITEAKLNMYSDTTRTINGSPGKGHFQTSGENSAFLRRITSAWTASTVSYNTKPSTDNVNQVNIPSTTSASQAYSIDVTALVKDEHANESLYHGFMIGMNDLSPYRQVVFYSSNCEFPELTPELNVTYTIKK